MHFFRRMILSLLLSVFFLTGCSDPNMAFENFTQKLFLSEVSSNTINLHYTLKHPENYGISEIPVTFGSFDFSPQESNLYLENISAALGSFSYNTLSEENQLTHDVLSCYLNQAKQAAPYYLYEEPLSPITGVHAQLPILLAEYPFYTEADVKTYLALLEQLPAYFDSLIHFEKEKAEAGLFMSEDVAEEVIAQCRAFVETGDSNYLISSFEERVSELDFTCYIEQNRNQVFTFIFPAYEKLASELETLKQCGKNAHGLCYFDRGESYYELLARTSTGSSDSPSELITIIEDQLAGDILALHELLEMNPSVLSQNLYFSMEPQEMLSTLQAEISHAFPTAPEVSVEIKQVPPSMEPYLSPAFYLIPAIDNYKENTIYLNGAHNMDPLSLFTTLAHEGYPGHLYQTTSYAALQPAPIRMWLHFPGYTEGWATYAEMCSYSISPLEKPLADMAQKNSSIILGLYARADVGIHYEGWTETDTLRFFTSYGISDEEIVRDIYRLILGDPANYLSYYVGYLNILELKKDFKGSSLEFHTKLLEIGPAPFDIIRKHL